jgi:hypothetical protein
MTGARNQPITWPQAVSARGGRMRQRAGGAAWADRPIASRTKTASGNVTARGFLMDQLAHWIVMFGSPTRRRSG